MRTNTIRHTVRQAGRQPGRQNKTNKLSFLDTQKLGYTRGCRQAGPGGPQQIFLICFWPAQAHPLKTYILLFRAETPGTTGQGKANRERCYLEQEQHAGNTFSSPDRVLICMNPKLLSSERQCTGCYDWGGASPNAPPALHRRASRSDATMHAHFHEHT